MDKRRNEYFSIEGMCRRKRITKEKIVSYPRLPKRTNFHAVPDEFRFKGVTDEMNWEERDKIVKNNNIEYTKQQYARMGIQIISEYDELFFNVELPARWVIKPTDHSMWNDVIDDKGRKRISFFYKSAPWDYDAFCNFSRRYGYDIEPFDEYESDATYEQRKFKPWKLWVTDCGGKIKLLKEITPKTQQEYLNKDDVFRNIARQYMTENYPLWEDINAYWD